MSPLCQTHIEAHQLDHAEVFYPLHVQVCEHCFLVQLQQYVAPEQIFGDYAYFSSYSDSWIEHARRYSQAMIERFDLASNSFVMEIASNDGYLLQHFVERGIPCLGIEPATNVAKVAIAKGIPTIELFFGSTVARELARERGQPDLLVGNNVLAHVPDLNDFVAGLKILLGPDGVITLEFPHLLKLMQESQFDTIYHEHFSYFSFFVVENLFERHGLALFDVEELSTHGGSLRIYARHAANPAPPPSARVLELRSRERRLGLGRLDTYPGFAQRVRAVKRGLLRRVVAPPGFSQIGQNPDLQPLNRFTRIP